MRVKTILRMLSVTLSAALLVTAVPAKAMADISRTGEATGSEDEDSNLLKIWYDKPASGFGGNENGRWESYTLPIGNSFMGANVYGEIVNERLTFNQKTLWNGGPSSKRPNYKGGNKEGRSTYYYQVVEEMKKNGNSDRASSLCGYLVGDGKDDGYGAYQSWGDIYLTFNGISTQTTGYERNLDLMTGIANVDFTADGTDYHREYFISYPDNVLVMYLSAKNGSHPLDVNVRFPLDNGESQDEIDNLTSKHLGKENIQIDVDETEGTIITSSNLEDNQLKMNSVLKVEASSSAEIAKGGDNESLDISGAEEIVIYISADTDYKNNYPIYRTGETDAELAESVKQCVDSAAKKGFDQVKEDYLEDYQGLFGRLSVDLGQNELTSSTKPTNTLLNDYQRKTASEPEKRLLEVLLYQYGRYLTIASSREGDLPSNLQGVWQNRVGDADKVPWACDYHINVNLQMNYWPTYSSNLVECATPLIDYIDSLREPGRVTAECYFGIKSEPGEANGFSAHTQCTPFGWTCPGWNFDWGWAPSSVPWIIQNCWEYYEYTEDIDYMREHIYPMLREQSILYDQLLVDSGVEITLPDGTKSTRLVSAPAYSPEHGPRTFGNVYENQLIWQMYEDAAKAAEILGVDADLAVKWKENQSRLAPVEIGDDGQIKEWFDETTIGSMGGEIKHRHMSHLMALMPGDLINIENKKYIDAAKVSLERRGYSATGWGLGQRVCAWARAGDGNGAYKAVESMFKDKILTNLWDTHPPFQIDGNFAFTTGINEMLMQSNLGYLNILPAIPDAWSEGSVDGLLGRGNFEIGADWTDKKATEIRILSKNGGECSVQSAGIKGPNVTVTDSKGNDITFTETEDWERITFDTVKGETYTITGFGEAIAEEERLDAPTGGAATVSENGVALSWNAVTGASSYNVYRKIGTDFLKINEDAVTGTTYTDEDVLDGEDASARYRIVAVRASGQEGKESGIIVADLTVVPLHVIIWFESDKEGTGSMPNPIDAMSGESITLPDCEMTVTGYLFAGWSDGKASYEAGSSYTALRKDTVFTPIWEKDDMVKIPKTGWTALAGSEQGQTHVGGDGPASWAVDDDETTWWHSKYADNDFPDISEDGKNNWFIIDFGDTIEADKFEYVPRTAANCNGFITGYQLYYSETEDGDDFELIKAGTWAGDTNKKGVTFKGTVSMRRLKIRAVATAGSSGANKYIHAAEFNLYRQKEGVVIPTELVADEQMTLNVGESKRISAKVMPEEATYKEIIFESSDSRIASVSADGTVTAGERETGTVVITMTAYGELVKTCTVTVAANKAIEKFSLDKEAVTLKKNESTPITTWIQPYYGTDKTVVWSSDNEKIAVFSDGQIIALDRGVAFITATASDGKTASCKVLVVESDEEALPGNGNDLRDMIAAEQNRDLSQYTAESAKAYQNVLAYAQEVMKNADASQIEIDDALAKLDNVLRGLISNEGLKNKIAEAEKITDFSKYTEDSAKAFQDALGRAKTVLANPNATKAEIDKAVSELDAAQKGLTEKGAQYKVNDTFEEGDFTYLVTAADTVKLTGATEDGKKKGTLVIPQTVMQGSFKVTEIGSSAFAGNAKLKKVTIGENVTRIEAKSFFGCKKLNTVTFKNVKAPKILKQAFKKTKVKCKVYYPKKMAKSQLKKLKSGIKKAGMKSPSYKAKK